MERSSRSLNRLSSHFPNTFELRTCALTRDFGLQTAHDVEDLDAGTSRWADDVRAIDVDIACTGRDKCRRRDELGVKIGRQHSGDDILPPAEHHGASDNRSIGVEPTFEEGVWENDTILAQRRRPTRRTPLPRGLPEDATDATVTLQAHLRHDYGQHG